MSEVVYFMPLFLTLHVNWDTKFQGIAFMVASILGVAGSYFAPKLINVGCSCGRAKDDGLEESDTTGSETVEVKKKIRCTAVKFFCPSLHCLFHCWDKLL